MIDLATAALRLVRAYDANVDAINGQGHIGTEHDRALHFEPCTGMPGVEHIYSDSTDCAACGGAQYGTEDEVQAAIVAVKVALGEPLRPYEAKRHEHETPVAGCDLCGIDMDNAYRSTVGWVR